MDTTHNCNGNTASQQVGSCNEMTSSHDLKNQSEDETFDNGTSCDTPCECAGKLKQLKQTVNRLEQNVEHLMKTISERDDVISKLRAENRQLSAELLEINLQKLQQSISEKDSTIAVLEIQLKNQESASLLSKVEELRAQRELLTQQLKVKVQERLSLFRKGSDEMVGSLAQHCQTCSKEQVCEILRTLELNRYKLKVYIDQLLAVVLEQCPSVLEGMPRIQQNAGMKLELLRMASLSELLEEVQEKEHNSQSLQSYASLLLQRIMDHSPELLERVSTINHFTGDPITSS